MSILRSRERDENGRGSVKGREERVGWEGTWRGD